MSSVLISGDTSGAITISAPLVAGSGTLTLPAVTDTLVGLAATQTLTNKTLTAPVLSGSITGTYTLAGTPTMGASVITAGTVVASTSGTSIDFTGIPSWVKRINVMFSGVSTSGTSNVLVQIGKSGGIENTGYTSVVSYITGSVGSISSTAGYIATNANEASSIFNGNCYLNLLNASTNTWCLNGNLSWTVTYTATLHFAGSKSLAGTLDRVRITTVNGTDTFDAGSINILYE